MPSKLRVHRQPLEQENQGAREQAKETHVFLDVRRYLNQRLDFWPIWVSYHGLRHELSTGCLEDGYPPGG